MTEQDEADIIAFLKTLTDGYKLEELARPARVPRGQHVVSSSLVRPTTRPVARVEPVERFARGDRKCRAVNPASRAW